MLEESISCSPGNDRKPSRSRRFHRKTKRKSQRLTGASSTNDSLVMDVPYLEALYEESCHSIGPKVSQYEDFNPFENEKLLAAADMTRASTSGVKLKNFPISQGFVKLEQLPVIGDIGDDNFIQPQPCAVPIVFGPETQFGITESEFVRFCDEAEVDLESNPTTDTKTPTAAKSIVDAILEDFCGSPYSESPPKFISEDATPIFRFKSKSLRTYGGLRKRRRNIVTELANANLRDDDGNASDSSGLSVQEDLSQNVVPQLDTVDLNNSINVCENLLNLSSYFSQTTSHGKSPPASGEKEKIPLSAVLENIMEIRRRTIPISRCKSEEEFHGFCNDDDSETKNDTLKDLLEDEDDVLQQINCDSLCYEKVVPKVSFAYNCSDMETVLVDVDTVIEEANRFLSSISYLQTKDYTSESHSNCDKHEDVSKNSSSNSLSEDEQLFEDIDFWNDNEYLLNYKTQKSNQGKPLYDGRCTSPFDGASLDNASENAELLVNRFEKKEPEKDSNRAMNRLNGVKASSGEDKKIAMFINTNLDAVKTVGNSASSLMNKFNVNEMRVFSKENQEKRFAFPPKTNMKEVQTVGYPSSSSVFRGFSTASRKTIAISDEAKRKADEILARFEQAETEQRMEASVELPMIQGAAPEQRTEVSPNVLMIPQGATERRVEASVDVPTTSGCIAEEGPSTALKKPKSVFLGFSTASRKPISISEDAKLKADEILKKFEQEEQEKEKEIDDLAINEIKEQSSLVNPSFSAFVGFSTASRKPIAISNEAKRKADDILKKFEQEERDEKLQKESANGKVRQPDEVIEDSIGFEFFEEAFEEELVADEELFISKINGKQTDGFRPWQKQSPSESIFDGFKNVSKKSIQISEDAKRPADQLLMEVKDDDLPQASSGPIFEGFKTASKKSIQISEDAKRRADQLLREVKNDDLPQDFLKCIEADLTEVNLDPPISACRPLERAEQVDGASNTPSNGELHAKSLDSLNGLYSASKKSEKLFEKNNHDAEHFLIKVNEENSLKIEGLREGGLNQTKPSSPRSQGKTKEFKKDAVSSFQECETTENHNSLKRKRNTFCTQDLDKTPVLSSPRRLSFSERTPLNRIENATISKTSSMPLIKGKSCFISRKNLLSLSKRKKCNSPDKVDEVSSAPKTPEKILQPPCPQPNATPNLKEFFDSVSTSTPRLIRNGQTKGDVQFSKDSSIDTDFRQINWEDANNSGRVCRNSSIVDLNMTCSEVSPSPKQRIERLKMYGEPPPISPILMVNKCRPSGLRRTRNSMKS